MRSFRKRLCLISVMLALQAGAQAVTIYTTLGEPGDTYNTSSGWLVNGSANPPQPFVGEAFAFTATGSGYLNQVRLALSGGSSGFANVSIALNSGGNLPGATLESFLNVQCSGPFGFNNPLVSLVSAANPLLQSGSTYWLCVEPAFSTASLTVNQNSLGVVANQAQEFSPSAWLARGGRSTFAFDVDVTPVPEPSTAALTALGMAVVIRRLRRRAD